MYQHRAVQCVIYYVLSLLLSSLLIYLIYLFQVFYLPFLLIYLAHSNTETKRFASKTMTPRRCLRSRDLYGYFHHGGDN